MATRGFWQAVRDGRVIRSDYDLDDLLNDPRVHGDEDEIEFVDAPVLGELTPESFAAETPLGREI